MREFEVLRRLSHQNIVKLFAVEETVGRLLSQRRILLTLTFEVQGEASYAHQQSRGIAEGRGGQTREATLKGVGPHREIAEKGKGNRCPIRESFLEKVALDCFLCLRSV